MPETGYLVDSNLLVLLVAGRLARRVIQQHRRLKSYSVSDYELLQRMIRDAGGTVFCTPNILTEATNHLRQCSEPWRSQLTAKLAELVQESHEIVVLSSEATSHRSYGVLGLADASSLEACSADRPLLTVDRLLFHEALRAESGAAVYFSAFREVPPS